MEKREDALREALTVNAEETARWTDYQNENKTAIENLDKFLQHLTVDVMVPIGSKAFMPGQLVHTNEVLVGHFQGYFSKCSAQKAKEICELRLRRSVDYLQKLKQEQDLWQNKLEKPYLDGAIPTGNEQEIIEDYDEEKEMQWRVEHARRVKEAKLNEKEERAKDISKPIREKTDDEILNMLEEAELMEELEKELESLDIADVCDDTIKKLMSGELELPPSKQRIAHKSAEKEESLKSKPKTENDSLQGVVKKSEVSSAIGITLPTNNNTTPNPDITLETRDDYSDIDELPEEVVIIRDQAKYLPPADRIGFYEYQLQILRQKMRSYTHQQFDEKMEMLAAIEHVEDLLDEAERALGDQELADYDSDGTDDKEEENANIETEEDMSNLEKLKEPKQQKRRISFALENQTIEFRKSETVSQMMPKPKTKVKRDIIKLDESVDPKPAIDIIETSIPKDYSEQIKNNRTEFDNIAYTRNFDLVDHLINSCDANTLYIHFKHSTQIPTAHNEHVEQSFADDDNEMFVPRTPADIYPNYLKRCNIEKEEAPKAIYLNSYAGEEEVKVPVLKEVYRQEAYENPKEKFSLPKATKNIQDLDDNGNEVKEYCDEMPAKSILRNKDAIFKEQHLNSNETETLTKQKKKKQAKPVDENDEYVSVYDKVMHDVVEKPLAEPEALPKMPYIDVHAPKKRISRFKQMRANQNQR